MHLVSQRRQTVRVADETFEFATGETIHTENSYKYDPETLTFRQELRAETRGRLV